MSEVVTQDYVGGELGLFAHAGNWKSYLRSRIQPYLQGSVLEVGAGNGSNTESLLRGKPPVSGWTCLEPDARLAGEIRARGLGNVNVQVGTLATMPADQRFDVILYIDVLEHIEADRAEAERAFAHLAPGGRLVVLSPAHQFLFSPFDAAIGHFRRYDRKGLRAAIPESFRLLELRYLDSVGMLASLANRALMKQTMPTLSQIRFWDGVLVRLSRVCDPLFGFRLGKSILGVWEKPSR